MESTIWLATFGKLAGIGMVKTISAKVQPRTPTLEDHPQETTESFVAELVIVVLLAAESTIEKISTRLGVNMPLVFDVLYLNLLLSHIILFRLLPTQRLMVLLPGQGFTSLMLQLTLASRLLLVLSLRVGLVMQLVRIQPFRSR